MKTSSLFEAQTYGNGNDKAVALVAGFASQSSNYLDQAARDFAAHGYDAVRYTHPKEILANGNPNDLLDLVDALSDDFRTRTVGYQAVRYCGVSLGGAIASQMQRHSEITPERGYYAATGGTLADIVTSVWFNSLILASKGISLKRSFERNGYDRDALREAWSEIQIIPETPLTIALGGLDHVVSRHNVKTNVEQWRAYNPDVEVLYAPGATHIDTITRFDNSVARLALDEVDRGVRLAPVPHEHRVIVDLSSRIASRLHRSSDHHATAA